MTHMKRKNFDSHGRITSYLVAGPESAEPMVLLHDGAWGGAAVTSWPDRLIKYLAKKYFIIAPDLYGFGQSSKIVQFDVPPFEFRIHQLAELLDRLKLGDRRAHFVGSSFGGGLALRAATTPWFSWRMKSATSIAGTGGPYRTKVSTEELAHFDGSFEDMKRVVMTMTGDFEAIDDYVSARLRTATDPAHYRAVAAPGIQTPFGPQPRQDDNYPQSLNGVQFPVHLVTGNEDPLVEAGWAEKILETVPHVQVHRHSGRHSPNIYSPVYTAKLLSSIASSQ